MFPELTNPLDVTRLEIVQFDEASHQCKKPFEVAQVMGRDGKSRWAIPSHFDYPADAKDHLADAASLLMDIKSINTAPGMDEKQGDLTQENIRRLHNEYGVVDPDPATVKSSDTGVGTRITLKNKEGPKSSKFLSIPWPDNQNMFCRLPLLTLLLRIVHRNSILSAISRCPASRPVRRSCSACRSLCFPKFRFVMQ